MDKSKFEKSAMPKYSHGEEVLNTVSHTVGGVLGVMVLVSGIIISANHNSDIGIITAIVYGLSMISLYTVSSIYHGLKMGVAKKIMRITDHSTIYFLIVGTYTPILLCGIRQINEGVSWIVFASEVFLAVIGITLNVIDVNRFRVWSMICYILMGWLIIFTVKYAIEAMTVSGFLWLLSGGIAFTLGAVLYGVGKRKKWFHSVFHIFVVIGTVLQAIGILFYVF